jgi:hypothetical protein
MRVLVTDKQTAQSLNGKYENDCCLEFMETVQGWIVGANVLTDKNFQAVMPQLNELSQIDYIAPSI